MKRDLAYMNGDFRIPSPNEVRGYVEEQARALLNVSAEEAFAQLDRGELDGTIAEVELRMMRDLLDASAEA
jgi:hypothetical protein